MKDLKLTEVRMSKRAGKLLMNQIPIIRILFKFVHVCRLWVVDHSLWLLKTSEFKCIYS